MICPKSSKQFFTLEWIVNDPTQFYMAYHDMVVLYLTSTEASKFVYYQKQSPLFGSTWYDNCYNYMI